MSAFHRVSYQEKALLSVKLGDGGLPPRIEEMFDGEKSTCALSHAPSHSGLTFLHTSMIGDLSFFSVE